MPGQYQKVVDDRSQLQYEHPDGTFVVANKQPDRTWNIRARGNRSRSVGTADTKRGAKRRMASWMQNHPGGLMGDVDSGALGTFEAVSTDDRGDGEDTFAADVSDVEASLDDDITDIEDELF